ncbi:MAG: hypothetical protein AAF713_03855 [Pseudomonadota bacterium]
MSNEAKNGQHRQHEFDTILFQKRGIGPRQIARRVCTWQVDESPLHPRVAALFRAQGLTRSTARVGQFFRIARRVTG